MRAADTAEAAAELQAAAETEAREKCEADVEARRRRAAQVADKIEPPLRVAFWSGHICERGTDTAMFDYADCGEGELGIVAYVLYDLNCPDNFEGAVAKFRNRFGNRVMGVDGFKGVDAVLLREGIRHVYLIKAS